jgi:hypothetical protein
VAGDVAARSVDTRAAIATTGLQLSTMATTDWIQIKRQLNKTERRGANLSTDMSCLDPRRNRQWPKSGHPETFLAMTPCAQSLGARDGRRLAREGTDSISEMLFLPVALHPMQQGPCRDDRSNYRD